MRALRTLAVLLALFTAAPAAAQIPFEKGIRLGVDLARFGGDFGELVDPDVKLGFTGGAWVAWAFTPMWGIESGIDWRMKGGKSELEATDIGGNPIGTTEITWDFQYVEVPLLLRLSMPGPVRAMLSVGPAFAFAVAGEIRQEGVLDEDFDVKDDLKSMDVGLQAGVGLAFPLGTLPARADVRYTHGLDDLYDIDDNLESTNQALALTLGIRF